MAQCIGESSERQIHYTIEKRIASTGGWILVELWNNGPHETHNREVAVPAFHLKKALEPRAEFRLMKCEYGEYSVGQWVPISPDEGVRG